MSAPLCIECEQPREHGATLLHVCHCDEAAGDLRVLLHLRDTEVTRLRAALQAIANLQPDEPSWEGARHDLDLGEMRGRHEASSLAAAALVSK